MLHVASSNALCGNEVECLRVVAQVADRECLARFVSAGEIEEALCNIDPGHSCAVARKGA